MFSTELFTIKALIFPNEQPLLVTIINSQQNYRLCKPSNFRLSLLIAFYIGTRLGWLTAVVVTSTGHAYRQLYCDQWGVIHMMTDPVSSCGVRARRHPLKFIHGEFAHDFQAHEIMPKKSSAPDVCGGVGEKK